MIKKYSDIYQNSKPFTKEIDIKFFTKEKAWRGFLYAVDIFLLSLVFLFFALGGSAFINTFICQSLNTNKTRLHLFAETTWEFLTIILLVFILLFYIPKIPSIVPFPNWNHILFREITKSVIVAAAVVFGHEKLLIKYQYLLGESS